MKHLKLRTVTVEGFTSIRNASVELGDLNVLIGANGAGKSNLIRALEMLGRIMDGELGLFTGLAGGAKALRSANVPPSASIRLRLDFDGGGYSANLISAAGDALIFYEEAVWSGDHQPHTMPTRGHGETMITSRGAPWSAYAEPIIDAIRGCRVFHFNDTSRTSPVKQYGYSSDSKALQPDAGNIAAVLRRLMTTAPAAYQRIVGAIQLVAPFFRDFVLEPELPSDRLRLRWRQTDSDTIFPPDAFSDGTLRFICLATLLTQPELPGLVILDEPELGLHPFAIVQLADMLRAASRESQVLIATQSVTLMNQFELDDLIVVERRDGGSVFERPDPDRLLEWLADYSLGDLWEKNLLGGRPRPERD
ncbi:MAG: AAA family ATPase [Streptosporangiaceae bacterium]|nr:AAA family ATPase [Streptosporangiaceae bacterium]